MRRFLVPLAVAAALGTWDGTAVARKLSPVDEASRNPSFLAFRTELLQAVERRDAAFIEAHLAPSAKLSFGGHGGLDGFRELWKPDDPKSDLWSTLHTLLRLGGTFDAQDRFVAPYTFTRFPDDLDPFEHVTVIRPTKLRFAPNDKAAVRATLTNDIVELVPWKGNQGRYWRRIKTEGGASGYVAARDLRSPVDYRAAFEKIDGRWMMTFLVAGD